MLLRQRLEPVPVQKEGRKPREPGKVLAGEVPQAVATEIDLLQLGQMPEEIRRHVLDIVECCHLYNSLDF